MIALNDKSTWFNEVNNFIDSYKPILIEEVKQENLRNRYETPSALILYNKILSQIIDYLTDKEIKCFHSTSILNPKTVFNEGLKILDFENQFNYVMGIINEKINSSIKDEILLYKNHFSDIFKNLESRENRIWFSYLASTSKQSGCYELFRYFGGEAVRRVFEYNNGNFNYLLENIGTPSVVEFKIKLKQTSPCQIQSISEYMLDKVIFPYKRLLICDGYTQKDILPEQIIKIQRLRKSSKWYF